MLLSHHSKRLGGTLEIGMEETHRDWKEANARSLIHIIWNKSDRCTRISVDGTPIELPAQGVMTTTYYHHVDVLDGMERLIVFSFDREFYCIYDHDSEVSCNGIIFFGAQELGVIALSEADQKKFATLLEVFKDEFSYTDGIQTDMLVMLLKRLIILCTRLVKEQKDLSSLDHVENDLLRQFHFLVDRHFREKKSIGEYADLLHKSPKTLSNVISKMGGRSPLAIIHDRVVLEARRQLTYTDRSINEIAYDLGYEEPTSFFKLFKKKMQESPQQFRDSLA